MIFCDKYQDGPAFGNFSHIHALVWLDRADMSNKAFMEFFGDLQKNLIADIVSCAEVEEFIKKGLVKMLRTGKR